VAVIVNLKGLGVARVEGGIWTSDDRDLAVLLNGRTQPILGSDPDPDLTLARQAITLAGGGTVLQKRAAWHPEAPAVA
jgi:hypothetical protein